MWAHRLVRGPGVCCACQRTSARLCVPLPPPPGTHTSLMETPGLQSSCLAARGPRPERAHHRLAPLKGTRQTQGPGEPPPELWGGPSQGRVSGVPRSSSPVFLHAEGPPSADLPRVWVSREVVGDFCGDQEGFDHRLQARRPHQTRVQSRQGHRPAQVRVAVNACGQHQRLSVWGGPRGAAHGIPGAMGGHGGTRAGTRPRGTFPQDLLGAHQCGQWRPSCGHAHPEIPAGLHHKEAAALLVLRFYSKMQR